MVTGATGFIAGHLLRLLHARGHQTVCVSRFPHAGAGLSGEWTTWDDLAQNPAKFAGIDAIVNLAGATINKRWTKRAKKRIYSSRIEATKRIAELVDRIKDKPKVVINGSGAGIYGTSETKIFTEQSEGQDSDFLGSVVRNWEAAADQIAGTRVVKLRPGVVLGSDGGAFPLMVLPYRLFAGGRIGSGKQWLPWIHIDDMAESILFCIECEEISGPVNCAAPHHVTNDEFGRMLGDILRRPHWLPVPAFLMRLALGEMSMLLLQGQRVAPQKLLAHGFRFNFPELNPALQNLLMKRRDIP
ncbi:MAG TPA: TIGR01777 family oxidoreductase [Bacilli bacterium]